MIEVVVRNKDVTVPITQKLKIAVLDVNSEEPNSVMVGASGEEDKSNVVVRAMEKVEAIV